MLTSTALVQLMTPGVALFYVRPCALGPRCAALATLAPPLRVPPRRPPHRVTRAYLCATLAARAGPPPRRATSLIPRSLLPSSSQGGLLGQGEIVSGMLMSFGCIAVVSIMWSLITFSMAFGQNAPSNIFGDGMYGTVRKGLTCALRCSGRAPAEVAERASSRGSLCPLGGSCAAMGRAAPLLCPRWRTMPPFPCCAAHPRAHPPRAPHPAPPQLDKITPDTPPYSGAKTISIQTFAMFQVRRVLCTPGDLNTHVIRPHTPLALIERPMLTLRPHYPSPPLSSCLPSSPSPSSLGAWLAR